MKKFIVFDETTMQPLGIYESEFIISDAVLSQGRTLIHAVLPLNIDPGSCKPEKIDGEWVAVSF